MKLREAGNDGQQDASREKKKQTLSKLLRNTESSLSTQIK